MLSLSGPDSVRSAMVSSYSVSCATRKPPSNSWVGLALTRFTAPAMAFLPNRMGCGPRSTSTRSRSRKAMRDWWPRPR